MAPTEKPPRSQQRCLEASCAPRRDAGFSVHRTRGRNPGGGRPKPPRPAVCERSIPVAHSWRRPAEARMAKKGRTLAVRSSSPLVQQERKSGPGEGSGLLKSRNWLVSEAALTSAQTFASHLSSPSLKISVQLFSALQAFARANVMFIIMGLTTHSSRSSVIRRTLYVPTEMNDVTMNFFNRDS